MKRVLVCSVLLCCIALALPALVSAVTYYASTGGSGSTCSEGLPCTLSGGINKLAAGDTLLIRVGTYTVNNATVLGCWTGGPSCPASGSAGAYTIIKNYPGEIVTINASPGTEELILMGNAAHHIEFNGLILDAANTTTWAVAQSIGATTLTAAKSIRYINVEVKNAPSSGMQIGCFSEGTEITNSRIHSNGLVVTGGASQYDYGLYLSGGSMIVHGNEIYNNGGYGLHWASDGGTSCGSNHQNPIVRHNIFHDNNQGTEQRPGMIINSFTGTTLIYNNIFYNESGGGLFIDWFGSGILNVFNNTFNNTGSINSTGAILLTYPTSYTPSVAIRNNIFNVFSGAAIQDAISSGRYSESNNLYVAAGFIDSGAADFRLQAGSPAIDSGITLSSVPTDILGIVRPQGLAYDIGAYEFTAGSNTYSVSRNLSVVAAGQQVTASWLVTPGPAQALDWIGLVFAGDNPESFISQDGIGNQAWTYTQGTLTGNFTIIAPFLPGTFEFIYCINNTYICPARSASFTITTPTGPTGFIVLVARWHLSDKSEASGLTDPDWIEAVMDQVNPGRVLEVKAGGRLRYRVSVCFEGTAPSPDYFALHCDVDGLDNWIRVADGYGSLLIRTAADSVVSMGQATTRILPLRHTCTQSQNGIFVADAINTSFTIQAQNFTQFDIEYAIDISPSMPLGSVCRCRPQHNNGFSGDFVYLVQPALLVSAGSHRVTSGRFTSGIIR